MITADTSMWVDHFRSATSPLFRLIEDEATDLFMTEVVRMELLAGARTETEEAVIREAIDALPLMPLQGVEDFEHAAEIWRRCRAGGETVRSLLDCLIAVVVLRADAHLIHRDRDFDVIARYTDLRVVRP